MSTFFTIAVIVLVFLIIFQIAKASEYVSVLKGEEKTRKENNRLNGFFMIAFLILGLIGVYWCNDMLYDKTLLAHPSASVQGEKVDSMLWLTLEITGVVFIITQVLLFWFAFRYQESDKRKAFFLPHNNTLEIVWTVIPAIALTVLVVIGLRNWFSFTGEAPKNAMQIEVTGMQFKWLFRYPGKDNVFGKKYYKMIDDLNVLGLNWKDSAAIDIKDDPAAHDDVVTEFKMYCVKGKPVKLLIGSRDVIHDVGLSWFRLKMDAVPGTPTTLWFTPKYTTKEMREETGNPNFEYEISCDQMCGNGHFGMRGIVEVVTQPEFDAWMAGQKSAYATAFPPAETPAAPAADTTHKVAAVMAKK
ncbi:MAG TPA: cytochrome c oxidase subunit II [Chitinophagaceae bacterium]|nr:cytochrome c oxidase subunit II [Chitinophagaceae bacterium]